jgi:hypothetical protein
VSGDLLLAIARDALGLGHEEPVPLTLPVWHDEKPCAGRVLGMGRVLSYDLARTGGFPVPLLPLGGNRYRVSTYAVLALLNGVEAPDAPPPAVIPLVRRAGAGLPGEDE